MNWNPIWGAALLAVLIPGPSYAGETLALADTPATATEPVREEISPSPALSEKIRDPQLRKHLLQNIDVFGKTDMPAIYILAPGIEDYEGSLLARDFSRDPFFMQNIDREEFEMKTSLREFHEDEEKDEERREQDLR